MAEVSLCLVSVLDILRGIRIQHICGKPGCDIHETENNIKLTSWGLAL